ncbi:unnamed protein product, partial [Ectocarpus sp. 8 AP-2014]
QSVLPLACTNIHGQLACGHVTERRSAESRVRRPLGATHTHVVQSQTKLPCFNAAHTFALDEDSVIVVAPSFRFILRNKAYCLCIAVLLCTIRCTNKHVYPLTHKHKDAIILVAVSRGFTNFKKATTPTHARLHIHAATHKKKRQLLHSEGFHQPSFRPCKTSTTIPWVVHALPILLVALPSANAAIASAENRSQNLGVHPSPAAPSNIADRT